MSAHVTSDPKMTKQEPVAQSGREYYCLFDSALGVCGIAWSDRGLTRLQLPEVDRAATERRLRAGFREPAAAPPAVAQAIVALQRYLDGEAVDFADLALDLTSINDFERAIYGALRRVGRGTTTTYGALAVAVGDPGTARAVGQAMARNPLPIIVPCHRVLASGRQLGGFSAYGGPVTKRRLLALEGVPLPAEAMRLPGL